MSAVLFCFILDIVLCVKKINKKLLITKKKETWIKPDDYITLNESTPQDYCYKHEPRPKGKGGGVATIYSNFQYFSEVRFQV